MFPRCCAPPGVRLRDSHRIVLRHEIRARAQQVHRRHLVLRGKQDPLRMDYLHGRHGACITPTKLQQRSRSPTRHLNPSSQPQSCCRLVWFSGGRLELQVVQSGTCFRGVLPVDDFKTPCWSACVHDKRHNRGCVRFAFCLCRRRRRFFRPLTA